MVSIPKINSCQQTAKKDSSRIVYSTGHKPESTTTMFDCFCKTMLEEKNISRMQKTATPLFSATKEELLEIANRIIQNSGANVSATARIKGEESSLKKVEKAFKEIMADGYEKARSRVLDLLVFEGPVSLVNDGYGIRFCINSPKTGRHKTANLLFDELIRCHKSPTEEVLLTEVEDYCGKDIPAYAGDTNLKKIMKLNYTTPGGRKGNTSAAEKIKKSGYTRSNISAYVKGKPTEIQIGGKFTTKWGDVEHELYNKRQGKSLDINAYKTQEQQEFAQRVWNAYSELLENKNLNKKYTDDYLNKIWEILVEAEQKNLEQPNYPELPQGVPEILSVENLMKLAHD